MGALFLTACMSSGSESPTAPGESHNGSGGRLIVGVVTDVGGTGIGACTFLFCGPVTSDPQIGGQGGMQVEIGRCCLSRSLLSYNGKPTREGGGELHPDLASSLPDVSADGLTWTFKIKPGIRYAPPLQDVEIQAGDFVRAIERAASDRPLSLDEGFGDTLDIYTMGALGLAGLIQGGEDYVNGKTEHISGLSAPDEATLVVHLTRPAGQLGSILSQPDMAPIPANPNDPTAPFGVA
ncbi:MAG: ABC transporter substrate-binding protein, partial [Actinobacteria bacterium]|nr:ABC transporter substrate-binding protein [Actinomycetota bacterium]